MTHPIDLRTVVAQAEATGTLRCGAREKTQSGMTIQFRMALSR